MAARPAMAVPPAKGLDEVCAWLHKADMAPTDAPLLKVPWLIVWWSSIVVLLEEHVDWLFWKSM